MKTSAVSELKIPISQANGAVVRALTDDKRTVRRTKQARPKAVSLPPVAVQEASPSSAGLAIAEETSSWGVDW